MPRDSTPRMVPILSASPLTGITTPGRANTAFMPVCALGAPQTTWIGAAGAGVDHAELQLVGVGMFLGRDDMGDGEILQPRAGILDRFHFETDGGELVGDRRGIRVGVEMVLQPGERELHRLSPPSSVGMSSAAKP